MWKRIFGLKRRTPQDITIVSGLPRSGTSMMMRMLEAGGMEVVVDNIRQPDDDNPGGYYEFEKVKKVKEDASFLDQAHGKVLKMVFMLLYDLPQNKTYNIIFMKRNMTEVLSSQKIMLQRHGQNAQQDDNERMGKIFEKHLDEVDIWLAKQKHMAFMYVTYDDVIQYPLKNAQRVNQFLGNRLDPQKMAAVVDATLYRNRA